MRINQIRFNKEVIDLFDSQISRYGLLETGGVLMGYVDRRTIFVQKASDGGPQATREGDYFRADPNYVDMFIDMEYANSNGNLRYLGEWHTHPQIEPEPSELDLISLKEIAESADDFAILFILGAIKYSTDTFVNHSISILKYNKIEKFYELNVIPNT